MYEDPGGGGGLRFGVDRGVQLMPHKTRCIRRSKEDVRFLHPRLPMPLLANLVFLFANINLSDFIYVSLCGIYK